MLAIGFFMQLNNGNQSRDKKTEEKFTLIIYYRLSDSQCIHTWIHTTTIILFYKQQHCQNLQQKIHQ